MIGFSQPAGLSRDEQARIALEGLRDQYRHCGRCSLVLSRRRVVFGGGHPRAPIMVVTTAPSWFEDDAGAVLANNGGGLVAACMQQAGLEFNRDIYATTIVKCLRPKVTRPDGTTERASLTDEQAEACRPALQEQFRIVQPAIIVAQGRDASRVLFGDPRPMVQFIGHWRRFHSKGLENCVALATYNPYGLITGERVALQGEFAQHWLGVAERLNCLGRIWRPDAECFKNGWTWNGLSGNRQAAG